LLVACISGVQELAELNGSHFRASNSPARMPVPEPHGWCFHASASLDDPDIRYFIGRVDGQAGSTSIAGVSDGVAGMFAVTTKPAYRRRSYGTALTWAALPSAAELPAVLGPFDAGEPMYRKMGFDDFHGFGRWRRKGSR
jgi:GNAT superfamily N-acetyltransferase